jgi:hypothetical protein
MRNAEMNSEFRISNLLQHSAISIQHCKFHHHHPQQSVLYRQAGQRQTACIRNISVPHRSQSTFSSRHTGGGADDFTGTGLEGSGIEEDYKLNGDGDGFP